METDRAVYLSLAELDHRYRQPTGDDDTGPLTSFELRCFSQHGEDGVIAEILSRIGITNRCFVEFGVESGREGNCVLLADVMGWSGLFIEAGEDFHAQLARKYAANQRVTTLRAAVTPENVQELFGRGGVPPEPDVISIDIDGADYWVWESMLDYRPRLVVVEYNAALPPGRRLVQPREHAGAWTGTDYFGASLDALVALGASKGYRLVHTELAAINAFFVRDDLAHDRFPPSAEVPRRSEPNYFMQGVTHLPDPEGREYVDLDCHAPVPAGTGGPPYTPATLGLRQLTSGDAQALLARTDILWHQRFELAPGVFTPGANDVEFLIVTAGIPARLDGASVLDIGTTNGGVAFELERRGAGRVVAVDILDADHFGFNAIAQQLGSRAEHVQASIYELPEILDERFDIVLFLGVLYHLRHPLLALDNVWRLTRGVAYIESAISDAELPQVAQTPVARFYRQDELAHDPSNWFSPNLAALADWCRSCGLEPEQLHSWPAEAPSRGLVVARPTSDEPEYRRLSYERPLVASVR